MRKLSELNIDISYFQGISTNTYVSNASYRALYGYSKNHVPNMYKYNKEHAKKIINNKYQTRLDEEIRQFINNESSRNQNNNIEKMTINREYNKQINSVDNPNYDVMNRIILRMLEKNQNENSSITDATYDELEKHFRVIYDELNEDFNSIKDIITELKSMKKEKEMETPEGKEIFKRSLQGLNPKEKRTAIKERENRLIQYRRLKNELNDFFSRDKIDRIFYLKKLVNNIEKKLQNKTREINSKITNTELLNNVRPNLERDIASIRGLLSKLIGEIETNKLYYNLRNNIPNKNRARPLKLTEIPINSTNLTEYEKQKLLEKEENRNKNNKEAY